MKNTIVFTIIINILSLNATFAQKGYPNPAAIYAQRMGYNYVTVFDSLGNQKGLCILPDSSKVDAWDFYRGKIKPEYSYCSKKGYKTKSQKSKIDGFETECTYCINENKKTAKDNFDELPMLDLMEKNGDTLIITIKTKSQNSDTLNISKSLTNDIRLKTNTSFPSSFDWRNNNGNSYIGPIRDQGLECGACYAFGAVACAEGVYNKALGLYGNSRKNFSESHIMWCLSSLPSYSDYFFGCVGADYSYMELEALTNEGICDSNYFPYTINQPNSCTHWNDPKAYFSDWQRVSCNDIDGIKNAILNYGVVDAAVLTSPNFENYSGGIYSDIYIGCPGTPCYDTPTNHAVAIVGWGYDVTQGEYWIMRNSWGSSWGESGYMRIKTFSARISCAVAYLVPNPVVYEAMNIIDSKEIPSGSNVEYIGHDNIILQNGFKANYNCQFIAKTQNTSLISSSTISSNNSENSSLKLFNFSDISTSQNIYETKIDTLNIEDDLIIYPNPVFNTLNIYTYNNLKFEKFELYNSNNIQMNIDYVRSSNCVIINFSNLPTGIYFVKIHSKTNSYIKKIIKI